MTTYFYLVPAERAYGRKNIEMSSMYLVP